MNGYRWVLMAGVAALVGCGGGDDAEPIPIPPPPPEPVNAAGLWLGSTSTGNDLQMIVDEDNVYWALVQSPLTWESSFVQGEITPDETDKTGETFVLEGREFYATGEVAPIKGEATVVSEASANGTATGNTNVRFNTVFDGRYYQSVTFAAVQGEWLATLKNPATDALRPYGAITVSRFGAVNGFGLAGGTDCTFNGNIIPAPGRGYYTISLIFSGSRACQFPGLNASGIALLSGTGTDAMLSLAALSTDRWQGVSAVLVPAPPPTPPTPAPVAP